MKIYISQDVESGEYFMWDQDLHYHHQAGPIEISPELYEQIREADKAFDWAQTILGTLDYEWQYPEGDPEMDCD